jgi:hypothetical protein
MLPDTFPAAGELRREEVRDLLGHSEAVFSADGTYRYLLVRRWATGPPTMTFLMLNPSTATAAADDPTIRRCIGFARREGCSALAVVNLFGLRATDPRELSGHADPVGPANDRLIWETCEPGRLVVAAWGVFGRLAGRAETVTGLLAERGVDLMCLGVTKNGAPRHPLYVRGDQPLVSYAAAGVAA